MRGHAQCSFALPQGLSDEGELQRLKVSKAAMNEFRRARGRAGAEIVFLEEENGQAPQSCIPCRGSSGDPASHDDEVEELGLELLGVWPFQPAHPLARSTARSHR